MFDMHYDLLTIAYKAYLTGDFAFFNKQIKCYNKNNITGLIANLYFMNKEDMAKEIHPKYYQENVPVSKMFEIATNILKKYIDINTKLLFGIEGCDYIEENELDTLYDLGLRSICVVWNEINKYGSGIKGTEGLTKQGVSFIKKAIEKGIAIDLSHANEKTFYDIIDVVKMMQKQGFDPIVYASHSNCRSICDRVRNLTDDQLHKIKEVCGYVGLMSNRNFVILDNKNLSLSEIKSYYLEHIKHVGNIIGFDHVLTSTDDMTFNADFDPVYGKLAIFNYQNIRQEMVDLLKKIPNYEDIMVNSANMIYDKLNVKIKSIR